MESQPQNPEFRNNPEYFHPCNSFICYLQITCANCLDLNQDRHNISTDLDPNHLTLKVFFE